MSTNNKHRKKNLLALFLSVLMVSSTAAAISACSKDSAASSSSTESESSTEESTTVNDDYIIKNAGFETFDTKDGLNAIGTTVTGWTRSTNSASSGSALSSKAASGILDTSADAWKQLTGSYYEDPDTVETLTEAEAEAIWDSLTVRDKLAYYEAWKDANDGTISDELEFYESFNIDLDDIPTVGNPGTHLKEGDEGYGEDTNILMIHNSYPDKDSSATYKTMGTAQKYSSSTTVTVPAGASAQFSVWVKTAELMSSSTSGASQEAVGKGAYISVTHSVGGTSLDAYQVKNINTEKMDEATLVNGWKEYTFYLQGSSYTSTTFSIVLGLGQGGGTDRLEYVNGYAFFDDVTCDIITNEKYTELMKDANKWDTTNDAPLADAKFDTEKKNKTVDASKSTQDIFAFDFYGKFTGSADILSNATATATKDEKTGYTSTTTNPAPWLGDGFDNGKDVYKTLTIAELNDPDNKYATAVYNQLKDDEFVKDEKVLMLLSAQGAAYEAKSTHELAFNADTKYIAVSFFVKTSEMNSYTGAGVTLVDGNAKTSFDAIDTTTIDPVTIGEDEDVYDGWVQYFFFAENDSDNDNASFTLSFNFGPTAIDKATTKTSYHAGFAAFAKFETYAMSKQEFDSVSADSYAKVVKVTANKADEAAGDSGFDTAAAVPTNAIENGIANLQNYKGVYSDSAYVNATGTNTEVNANANAGLISREYFADYYDTATGAWLNGLKSVSGAATADETWNTVFGYGANMGSATQPLLIWNDGAKDKAYGFIGKSTSVAADAYTAVSVRVKVGAINEADKANTFAYIYLIDTTDNSYGSPLSIGRGLTYWYDDDGNICTGDPTKKDTEIAFRLQANGLYKASKTWSGYSKLSDADKEAYFANLDNYAKDEETGNLLVADGGASHDYSDYWNNEGMDGVAFYYNKDNSTYYADRAKTVPVKALSTIADLERFDAVNGADNQMVYKVGNTNGEWATVTFYIHAGNDAKNYRLEVWSGERNGAANPANSYVIFDANNPGTADSNFSSLIEDYEDKAQTKVEGVFSYFDSAKYLRYNAELDENKIGNLYEKSYVPSSYTEGIVYLAYADGLDYTAFADYSYSEITVAATVEEEEEEEDKTDDSTEDGTNVWLLASSIVLAAVLLLAIASIAIRKILKKHRKTRAPKVKKEKTKKSKKD